MLRLTPSRPEGRIAIVTDAGWNAVDAAASGATGGCRAVLSHCVETRERCHPAWTNGACARRSLSGRSRVVADGKAVWSWHPLLVLSFAEVHHPNRALRRRQFAKRRWQKEFVAGESTE